MKTNTQTSPKTNFNTKKIMNWREYNKSLVGRGNISIYISESIAHGALITPKRQKTHKPGHPKRYPDALIELILTIRELFHLPLRQSTGLAAYIFGNMGIELNIPLPNYTTLSRRMAKLEVDFCHRFRGKNVVLLIDSSGFKVFGEGEWKVRKHGYSYRRTWRTTHIAIDLATRNIIGLINTKSGIHDNTQLIPILDQVKQKHEITAVIGDGAYDSKDNYLMAREQSLDFIAPPPRNATEHINSDIRHYRFYDTPGWEDRNAVIRHIEQWGLDGWKADTDYHRRSLVENAIYRFKTIFRSNLKSRKEDTQLAEQQIRASLINWFNEMGLPKYMMVR